MPSQSTGLKPKRPPSFRTQQWLACIGMLAALGTGGQAFAQADANAALIEQGNYWQAQGRADLAEESWKKLLSVNPQSADAMYGMAQVELSRNNAEQVRTWTARLRTAHPNDPRVARLQQQAQQPGQQGGTLQRARAAARAPDVPERRSSCTAACSTTGRRRRPWRWSTTRRWPARRRASTKASRASSNW
ncbi:tetratricopeptide repeat protein [Variovorax sp. SCN45]|uniref:tetratricopeptide repeat protein n=1 Tax=Variovorax sp. SCN45 TaxID=3394349 RepID=UPI0039BE3918